MNKVLFMAALIMSGLAASCGEGNEAKKESKDDSGNGISGTWKVVKARGPLAEINIGNLYIFEHNKITLKGSGVTTPGSWLTKSDTLIFTMEGDAEFAYLHEMKGKQMVIKPIGSDLTLYLDKTS